jgi:predicted nucleic-acid-binding protein
MMSARRFVDTNVILAHFVFRPPQSHPTTKFFEDVWAGKALAETSIVVILEAVFVLERHYQLAKSRVRELILDLLRLRSLRLPGRTVVRAALDLYVDKNVSFVDAIIAMEMRRRGINEILSFDRDDRLPRVTRIDPTELLDKTAA